MHIKREMRQHLRYNILLMLLFVEIFCSLLEPVNVSAAKIPTTGWYKDVKGNKYYYKDGTAVKGWKKIDSYWYRFNGKGVMNKNRIVQSKDKAGYRFVGPDGILCKDPVIQKAVDIVMKRSGRSKTNRERLKQVYDYLKTKSKYRSVSHRFSVTNIPSLARSYLDTLCGECITCSRGFAYVATVLGSNVRLGRVNWHTWPELATRSTWYVYDLSREFNSYFKKPTWYKISRKSNTTYYKYEVNYYQPKIKKGKLVWARVR